METGSSIAHMLESTMLISGFRGFSVITVQRGFILGRACGRRGPLEDGLSHLVSSGDSLITAILLAWSSPSAGSFC